MSKAKWKDVPEKLPQKEVTRILEMCGYEDVNQVRQEASELSAIHAINQSEKACELLAQHVSKTMAENRIKLPYQRKKHFTFCPDTTEAMPVKSPTYDHDDYESVQINYERTTEL